MGVARLFNEFVDSEKSGGLLLLFGTAISLILANSTWQADFINIWQADVGCHSVVHWINDGLMTIFFLLIGLELEREIYTGELSNIKNASLPIFGALGGMLVPSVLFILINLGKDTMSGAGIPMATDIAFAIGILSLLGSRVPSSLKIFLTALAVIDDLGAIMVIAIFYSKSVVLLNLIIALVIFALLLFMNKRKVYNLIPYIIGGIFMWYFMLNSGVHATIAGVLLAFAIPFAGGGEKSPSFLLQHHLHKPVAFFILPLFAIANTCIPLSGNWFNGLTHSFSFGIITGLVIGKPAGILLFSFVAVKMGLAVLPGDLNWKAVLGAGFLGGIGFTMSIFIALLAFDNIEIIDISKIAILVASFIAGTIGIIWLKINFKENQSKNET